jgi:TDG/mug DNA glycosylase family protein
VSLDLSADTPMAMTLPDILRPGLSAVFCGINPALSAVKDGHHFSSPSNRFWRTLHLAGFTPFQLAPADDARLLEFGYGVTAAVARASRAAEEVDAAEFRKGLRQLETRIRRLQPQAIAFLGKPAWSIEVRGASFDWGRQPQTFGGGDVWVLPNPSGLNRNFSLDDLASAYREMRLALDAGTSSFEIE